MSRGWEKLTEADITRLDVRHKHSQDTPPRTMQGGRRAGKDVALERPRVDLFLLLLQANHLPAPETEYRFLDTRKFLADYCWPDHKLIVEREGGLWSQSERAKRAHAAPLAILRDMERLNLAQVYGFRYLRFTPEQLDKGSALPMIQHFLRTP